MTTRRTTYFNQQAGTSTPLRVDFSNRVQNYQGSPLPDFGPAVGAFNPAQRNTSYLPDFGALSSGVNGIEENLFAGADISRLGSRTRADMQAAASKTSAANAARFGEGGATAFLRSIGSQGAQLGANNFMGDLELQNRSGRQQAQFQKANLRNAIAAQQLAAQGQQDSFDLANQSAGLQHSGLLLSQRGQDQGYALNRNQAGLNEALGLGGLQNESARTGLAFADFLDQTDNQDAEQRLRERAYRDSRADANRDYQNSRVDRAQARASDSGNDTQGQRDFIGRLAASTSPDVFGRIFKMFPNLFGNAAGSNNVLGRFARPRSSASITGF